MTRIAVAGLALLLAAPAVAQVFPPVEQPALSPPPAAAQAPAAHVVYAPYRYDDILYENDRIAHRIYGPALQAHEPPAGSGIDVWGKNVRWVFMERQLATGDQHAFHGEGLDFYNVGGSRGAGGLGIWCDNKLWVSRDWKRYTILKDGPDVARFRVSYAPWPVDVVRKVWETREFALPAGSSFTRLVSTISSNLKTPLTVGIGVTRRATGPADAAYTWDAAAGLLMVWGPEDKVRGNIGVAIKVDPAMVAGFAQDAENDIVLLKVKPGKPFVYYSGAAWDKGLDFHSRQEWEAYARAYPVTFKP